MQTKLIYLTLVVISLFAGNLRASDQNTNPGVAIRPVTTDTAIELVCYDQNGNLAPLVLSPAKADAYFWLVGGQFQQHLNNLKFETLPNPHAYRFEGNAPRHLQGLTYAAKETASDTWTIRLRLSVDEVTTDMPCGAWDPHAPN